MTETIPQAAPSESLATSHLLWAGNVTRRFGGITALQAVSLWVDDHEFVGLIGPNGAGKTTLFDCLYGSLRPNQGVVMFAGHDLATKPEYQRSRMGLGRTFQRTELFPEMTVRGHFEVAVRSQHSKGSVCRDLVGLGRVTPRERAEVDATVDLLGLGADADRAVEALSLGRGRLVELGRALLAQPRLLLLDEPSSGLDRDETTAMVDTLRTVREERGIAILLIEHDVEMVASACERLYVLDAGRMIAEGSTQDVLSDPAVQHAYLGSAR